ncbi:camk/mapkapk/mapkapk protein kinase [Salpingoeca rosetta]|uniref:Camk/mapkapk/mapkapk protein kinase n=1 Tax=Salpingoeca rosetta (strain ATCC 50818 / BSB-021) TaxID=946362 RepID=F2UHL7_SALR5|nr:camk/mapkapk/mapkapk protein kinase [Salpingoeca rosetta]EGD76616.1 camk/mapkapk/mapkapk protein kinase [Salpingoeca rosetta]|eukprot:XP_004991530.1 camk/mapkapk/mapkapk protein kinase [Salpingoeca rosetta]
MARNHDHCTMMAQLKTTDIHEDYSVFWDQTIGNGTNGPVFACVHKETSKQCALKCLPGNDAGLREAHLHQQLAAHPCIVPVMDVYDASITLPGEYVPERRVLLVTERMQGGELYDHITQNRKFSENDARVIMRQLAQAVAHCHRNDVAHRDIKPENFLLHTRGDATRICLTDFGYAKQDNGDLHTPVFTPFYVCPQILESLTIEQRKQHGTLPAHHRFTYDKRCDMWSLGVIMYILLCGYPPFRPNHASNPLPFAMRQKIKAGSVHFSPRHWQDVSNTAKELIRHLLHVDERKRLDAEQLLLHPWMCEGAPCLDDSMLAGASVGSSSGGGGARSSRSGIVTTARPEETVSEESHGDDGDDDDDDDGGDDDGGDDDDGDDDDGEDAARPTTATTPTVSENGEERRGERVTNTSPPPPTPPPPGSRRITAALTPVDCCE